MSRTRDDDACPGALQVHQAADGALARLRLPGGMITAGQLEALAHAATEYGNGTLELTVRGNVQLRGVRDTAAVADAAAGAGLLPSTRPRAGAQHHRLAAVGPGRRTRRRAALGAPSWTAAIQSDPELARLPGRFMFGLDDGTGDISGLRADVGAHVLGDRAALLLAGRDTGVRLALDEVVPALLAVARRFVEVRGKAWRVSELDDPSVLVSDFEATAPGGTTHPPVLRPPVGWILQDDGQVTLGAAVPLGVLEARQAQFVAAIDAPVVITPWRSLLVCDLADGRGRRRRCGCWRRWAWCSTRIRRGCGSAPASAARAARSRWPTCGPRPPGPSPSTLRPVMCTMWAANGPAAVRCRARCWWRRDEGFRPQRQVVG